MLLIRSLFESNQCFLRRENPSLGTQLNSGTSGVLVHVLSFVTFRTKAKTKKLAIGVIWDRAKEEERCEIGIGELPGSDRSVSCKTESLTWDMSEEQVIGTTLPHSSFGDPDCCGCLNGCVANNRG